MRLLAEGVIAAVNELDVKVPIVIWKGRMSWPGNRCFTMSGLNFTTCDTMGQAAEQVVALAT